ncbi:MAG TPA: DMT family transporter [Solirubrobacteraceae bacterium]|jgi:drug/metabolite transporter (DMT)-like permease
MPVVPIVLVAAALHATWNALVKTVTDRLALMAVMGATTAAICLPAAVLVLAPRSIAWPELGVSALLHTVYNLLLIEAYRDGEFNQVYPVARGTAPPTVAIAAALVVGETLSLGQVVGVLAISGGLFSLAAGQRHGSRRALGFAVLTGLAIASYTVIDGVGVRKAGSTLGYISWLFLASGLLMPVALVVGRRLTQQPPRIARELVGRGAVAGTLSLVAYGLVLWAQTSGDLAVVAALRETSVVFAAIIGAVALREHLPRRRIIASVVIAGGAALLALG